MTPASACAWKLLKWRSLQASWRRSSTRAGVPVRVLIPVKGWSDADKEGMPLFDPAATAFSRKSLKALLDQSRARGRA